MKKNKEQEIVKWMCKHWQSEDVFDDAVQKFGKTKEVINFCKILSNELDEILKNIPSFIKYKFNKKINLNNKAILINDDLFKKDKMIICLNKILRCLYCIKKTKQYYKTLTGKNEEGQFHIFRQSFFINFLMYSYKLSELLDINSELTYDPNDSKKVIKIDKIKANPFLYWNLYYVLLRHYKTEAISEINKSRYGARLHDLFIEHWMLDKEVVEKIYGGVFETRSYDVFNYDFLNLREEFIPFDIANDTKIPKSINDINKFFEFLLSKIKLWDGNINNIKLQNFYKNRTKLWEWYKNKEK